MQNSPSSSVAADLAAQATRLQKEGKWADAVATWKQALSADPANAKLCYGAAAASYAVGQWADAASFARQALQQNPGLWAAQLLLGSALLEAREFAHAVDALRSAVANQPGSGDAQMLLGIALQAQGNPVEAENHLRKAVQIQPQQATAHYALGRQLADLNRTEEAIAALQTALSISPNHVESLIALGQTLSTIGRTDDALACLERAVALQPRNAHLLNALGIAYKDLSRLPEAALSYRRCIELAPNHAEALGNLGMIQLAEGDVVEARRYFDASLAAKHDVRVRVTRDLMLPPIMGDWPSVLESRRQYAENLDRLIEDKVRLDNPDKVISFSNFYLAYHGLDNRPLQERFAQFCLEACPSLGYESPNMQRMRKPGRKRIGFLSRNLYEHSVALCFSKVVDSLARSEHFDVHLISGGTAVPARRDAAYPDFSGRHIELPNHLADARDRIAALDLDILVYLDIGMDSQSLFLAFARLARVQCVLGGHPDTTGIPSIDYFISSDIAESPEADAHYSEGLIRLRSSTYYFERPTLPQQFSKTRADFGLPASGQLYSCPVKLQKIHPDFDQIFNGILDADPDGHVVLFEDHKCPLWSTLLARRLDRSIRADLRKRIHFLPWVRNTVDFANVNALADMVLDPPHFGIGSTAITLFAVGAPMVTLPSAYLRGRTGLYFSRIFEMPEFVAADAQNYVAKAVRVARSADEKRAIRQKILDRSHVLYENMSAVHDLSEMFQRL